MKRWWITTGIAVLALVLAAGALVLQLRGGGQERNRFQIHYVNASYFRLFEPDTGQVWSGERGGDWKLMVPAPAEADGD